MGKLSERRVLAGAATVYVAAAVGTGALSGHHLAPLYEGVGPASPYRWVHPPAALAANNLAPEADNIAIALSPGGSNQASMPSIDSQLILTFPTGAFPPAGNQTAVRVAITPLDPAKLEALPKGLYSDGNAYRIDASYEPGHAKIPATAQPVDLVLTTPVASAALLFSSDGRHWQRLADQHIPNQAAVAATIMGPGTVLAAARVAVVVGGSGSGLRLWIPLGLGGVAVVALGGALIVRRRMRGPGDAPGPA